MYISHDIFTHESESVRVGYNFLPRDAVLARYMLSSCVSPSVRMSQVGVLQRWLNLGLHKQRLMIGQGLRFSDAKYLGEIPTGSPPTGAPNRGWIF